MSEASGGLDLNCFKTALRLIPRCACVMVIKYPTAHLKTVSPVQLSVRLCDNS
ncbi:hypothetical protein J6590_017633 [Homalodisca vitripennis]|nr:hypothetical protein J6590_017633 [Homalodisca vitripennis]